MAIGGMKRGSARLLAVAACGLALAAPSHAQQTAPDPTELDPDAPMDAMPDLGVEWPDMNAPDAAPVPDPGEMPLPAPGETAESEARDAGVSIDDSVAARRYVVRIEGLGAAESEALLKSFKQQSALDEGGKTVSAAILVAGDVRVGPEIPDLIEVVA